MSSAGLNERLRPSLTSAKVRRRLPGLDLLIVVGAILLGASPAFAGRAGGVLAGASEPTPSAAPLSADARGPKATSGAGGSPAQAVSGATQGPAVVPPLQDGPTSATKLHLVRSVHGRIAPKSVVASGTGLVIADNMMYRHSVTLYDAKGRLIRTISDKVTLADLGWPAYPDPVRGAPVEAAFSPDGKTAYVSNYSMYGPGFLKPGWDLATPADHIDRSFVYRIDVASGHITGAAEVGSEPKFLAVSPDGSTLIVANWASWDLSIVDLSTFREIRRIPVGPEPRGIAFAPDGSAAYVSVQYRDAPRYPDELYRLDTTTWKLTALRADLGPFPRHLVIDPSGRYLYASLTGAGRVIKIEAATGKTVGTAITGAAPRTIVLSPDGRNLYVVNYDDATLSKVDTATMRVVQTLPTGSKPVGVTYEPTTDTVWVACYSGSLMLFHEGT